MALQISISNAIGARAAAGAGGIDPDAQAFITASGITDATQQSAINQLVLDLKGYSIWTKFSALYPFIGGTASTHKFNLKNPLDTDAAFRLVFSGGWTHSSTGATPNGINAYANTFYTPSSHLADINSNHISYYSRTNATGGIEMGGGPVPLVDLVLKGNESIWNMASFQYYPSQADTRYFLINSRTSSNLFKFIKNGVVNTTSTNSAGTTKPNTSYYIGKRNYPDNIYSTKQCAFASIGDGLTDTEAANLYTAVQAFQTTLGRSIGTQTVSDADAQAFVTAANIQDQVEATAVNNLTIGLKADGLWNKSKAIYPFVGGSSSSTTYNLKNTSQFQISWNGGWTWDANGVKGNGVNSYGNTGFNFSTQITSISNFSVALYTNQYTSGGVDFGADNNSNWYLAVKSSTFGSNVGAFAAATPTTYSDTTGLGFYTGVKLTNPTPGFANIVVYKNGSSVVSAPVSNGTVYNGNVYIGGLNRNGSLLLPTNIRYAFSAIFDASLTATEATNLNSRVTTFQTALNRNI